MLDFHSENLSPKADGGIIRTYIRKPKSDETATDGSYVTSKYLFSFSNYDQSSVNEWWKTDIFICLIYSVHLTGKCQGRMFEDRDFDFYLGETEEADLCPAIPIALKRMGEGEKSK